MYPLFCLGYLPVQSGGSYTAQGTEDPYQTQSIFFLYEIIIYFKIITMLTNKCDILLFLPQVFKGRVEVSGKEKLTVLERVPVKEVFPVTFFF